MQDKFSGPIAFLNEEKSSYLNSVMQGLFAWIFLADDFWGLEYGYRI